VQLQDSAFNLTNKRSVANSLTINVEANFIILVIVTVPGLTNIFFSVASLFQAKTTIFPWSPNRHSVKFLKS